MRRKAVLMGAGIFWGMSIHVAWAPFAYAQVSYLIWQNESFRVERGQTLAGLLPEKKSPYPL